MCQVGSTQRYTKICSPSHLQVYYNDAEDDELDQKGTLEHW